MIVRSPRPTGRFTVIANATARDHRLSFKARGILIELLSLPDNWRTSAEDLARRGPDGLTAIRAGLKELETFGYLKRTKHRDDLGRIRTTTTVYDRPLKASPPESGFPTSENLTSIERPKEKRT